MDGRESGQSVEGGRSRVKVDGLLTKRRRSFRTWGLLKKSERSQDKLDGPSETVSNIE